jgi:hypothetical protein
LVVLGRLVFSNTCVTDTKHTTAKSGDFAEPSAESIPLNSQISKSPNPKISKSQNLKIKPQLPSLVFIKNSIMARALFK